MEYISNNVKNWKSTGCGGSEVETNENRDLKQW